MGARSPESAVSSELPLTAEQRAAVELRDGDLLLDAGAGSGKTTVLVERFVRAVLEDEVDVSAILAITFTDKAAAELRDRIRARLRSLGAVDAARATEGAFISTIHGFCARLLRANALAAGLDPSFGVLDRPAADRLADRAFDDALPAVAERVPELGDLLAAPGGVGAVRGAVLGAFSEFRSRGMSSPALPPLSGAPLLEPLRAAVVASAGAAARSLGELDQPSAKVVQALARLERVPDVVGPDGDAPWPGELDAVRLPGGNGAALSTEVCLAYAGALVEFRAACAHRWVAGAWVALDELLREFGVRYAALKRRESALDFEDLELIARDLLVAGGELRERYRRRFAQIMVDEFQDTNAVQLELIESIADGNLFTVGDAQQSIYGFRHADVELFERRGEALAAVGRRLTLSANFRSRPKILAVVNAAFADVLGERFRPLVAGRAGGSASGGAGSGAAGGPLVELLVADKGSEWDEIGIAAPWRIAEARALAARIASLVAAGDAAPRDVVVLTRATTDLRAYERALEERGVSTYVIGGRGYWAHPQVVDLVAYLRALANPRDEEALYTVLASPLVGCSLDALVILGAASRATGRDPWWVLRDPGDGLDALAADDRSRLAALAEWFAAERAAVPRSGIEQLIERALELSGYDLAMLAMPGGPRRLANVRKLMRLGRAWEAESGPDLRGFLALVQGRASGWSGAGDPRESEAPVEGEALDAVRLMTIHRAKGLEFPVVCVADLGRVPWRSAPLLRLGRDGRVGVRLARPGTGGRDNALDYDRLRAEGLEREAAEERRLFYVAMTRAEERLIVSGAVNLARWEYGYEPMAWVGRALVPDIAERMEDCVVARGGAEVAVGFVRPGSSEPLPSSPPPPAAAPEPVAPPAPPEPPTAPAAPPVSHLSYSSLGDYARCGYRFYLRRVLGLPEAPPLAPPVLQDPTPAGLTALDRGTIAHALLERLDFRRPLVPTAEAVIAAAVGLVERSPTLTVEEAAEIAALIEGFCASALCRRLAAATGVRREERFGFELGGALVVGVIDVLAWEPGQHALVIDYKTDPLGGAEPEALITGAYATQRLIYALAALRGGAEAVEVAHLFLERPEAPAVAAFTRAELPSLEARLSELAAGVLGAQFVPAAEPHRGLCSGCPGENGMCSWPPAMTRREAVDRLF
jgi:ATP-dependent helicase/nuclease subunit A